MNITRAFVTVIASVLLSVASSLTAAPTPTPPSNKDLQEEQRIILNAYIARGDEFLTKSRDQLLSNRLRPSKENGFHAVELLARARAKLDRHPERIEQLRGFNSTNRREQLRKTLKENIDPRYFALQERLENVAEQLTAKGDSSLETALSAAKQGDEAAVQRALKQQGIRSIVPAEGESESSGSGVSSDEDFSNNGSETRLPNGGSASQQGGNVIIRSQSGAETRIPGQLVGNTVKSGEYGDVDLASGVQMADGSTAYQTSKGVLVVGPDGNVAGFIPGGKLNGDGSATLKDGSRVSLNGLRADPSSGGFKAADGTVISRNGDVASGGSSSGSSSGSSGAAGGSGNVNSSFTGRAPGVRFVDAATGSPITVDPDWENGEQRGVRRDYIGGRGAKLVAETRVVRKIVQSSGNEAKVNVTDLDTRSWKLSIVIADTRTSGGNVQATLTLTDANGSSDFTLRNWQAVSSSGARAEITPSADKPSEATATFSQDGDYEITAEGETGWGSPFKITGKSSIYR